MKSPPMLVDDGDDIFGPPRTHATGYCSPKNRPSMISAKYRQKEERRKVLKISVAKLKKIDDPEASLCRSVLINNTMKRLQKEARDEKLHKQQLNYPSRGYDSFLSLRSELAKSYHEADEDTSVARPDNFIESDFPTAGARIAEEVLSSGGGGVDHPSGELVDDGAVAKRTYDEIEDSDVQDVLKQFYMPPTPLMLTCIDEDDEDVNVVDEEPLPKRQKLEDELRVNHYVNNNNNVPEASSDSRLRYLSASDQETNNPYNTCGQASMFCDIQSNVFHSLIASLET